MLIVAVEQMTNLGVGCYRRASVAGPMMGGGLLASWRFYGVPDSDSVLGLGLSLRPMAKLLLLPKLKLLLTTASIVLAPLVPIA